MWREEYSPYANTHIWGRDRDIYILDPILQEAFWNMLLLDDARVWCSPC